jgi:GAF domain-containing protein
MLEQMRSRLRAKNRFETAIEVILDDVIALHGAEFGDVQLPIGNELVIVAQRGLTTRFLNAFARVKTIDGCACGQALKSGEPVVIRDVEEDMSFEPFRAEAMAAGYRGVQSTPFFTQGGIFMAMVSTLFASPHTPTDIEMQTLKTYGQEAAGYLYTLLQGSKLADRAEQMRAKLYGLHPVPKTPS